MPWNELEAGMNGVEGGRKPFRGSERGSSAAGPVGHPPAAVLAKAPRGRPWPPPAGGAVFSGIPRAVPDEDRGFRIELARVDELVEALSRFDEEIKEVVCVAVPLRAL